MRVLLTGATGFVGKATLDALVAIGVDVVTLGRTPVMGHRNISCDLLLEPDFNGLVGQAGATHLVHLAWTTEHGKFWNARENIDWMMATISLISAFCDNGGRGIVAAGSCAEYDWKTGWCDEAATPTEASSLYGVTKDATRRAASAIARQSDVPLAWGRIFLSYGQGEDDRRLIPSLTAALRDERPAFSVDCDAQRDFLHVSDVAAAFVAMLVAGMNGPANVSSGRPVPLSQVIRRLAFHLGADPSDFFTHARPRSGEPRLLAGPPSRLYSLGWTPKMSLDEGLAQVARRV